MPNPQKFNSKLLESTTQQRQIKPWKSIPNDKVQIFNQINKVNQTNQSFPQVAKLQTHIYRKHQIGNETLIYKMTNRVVT